MADLAMVAAAVAWFVVVCVAVVMIFGFYEL
jgi:hypothetical protein